jgi:sigma-B regulation protein RsbU (phosphoserine phosphatase)
MIGFSGKHYPGEGGVLARHRYLPRSTAYSPKKRLAMNAPFAAVEPDLLYQKLNTLFNGLEHQARDGQPLESFVEDAFQALKLDLRLLGVLVFVERREGFELRKQVGEWKEAAGESIPASSPTLRQVLRHRVYIFADPEEPGSPWREGILPCVASAGIVVGRRSHRHVLFFLMDEGWARGHVDFALNVLRGALGQHVLEEQIRRSLRHAAEVQDSLLDLQAPSFPGFEIACRSVAAEEVGGDFFDFLPLGRDVLGFAVGDACGHGLGAALLVRDVMTGLRMGIEKHLRMEYVFAKLNRVIHRSNFSSRFVSVFYGELESGGGLSYVNAGHQPPVLVRADRVTELTRGGPVVGPLPEATYRRGFVKLEPGEVLLVASDGILDRQSPGGEFFGGERLERLVRARAGAGAAEVLERAFDGAFAFGAGRPWEDDVTLMVIRRRD